MRSSWAIQCILLCLALGTNILRADGAAPLRTVLTDVERNIYVESFQLARNQVSPDCPHDWSVRKYLLHGGKQEGVEVIDVDNGKLRFQVIPTRGMGRESQFSNP